jgi:cobalt-zinc-cadmium efflux system membrane fusion protein
MIRNIIAYIAAGALALAGLSCSKKAIHGDRDEAKAAAAQDPRHESGDGAAGSGPGGRGSGSPGRSLVGRGPVRLTEEERKAVEIETAKVSFHPMASHLQVMGKVFAHQFRKAIVSYPFPARIAHIHVLPGEWVDSGRELVTLQSEAVGQAKSEYFKAIADHELALINRDREKRLFDKGAGAGKNLQTAEAELKVAEASLEAAEKMLHVLGFSEAQVKTAATTHEINAFITLFAPIPGKVIANNLVLGGMVDQATEVLTILDPRMLCVDAEIYERDIARVRIGQKVEVEVPAYDALMFKGTLKYIGDTLNEETRTVTVRTEVENKDDKLKPGMFANVRIVLGEDVKALVVPDTALLDDGGRKIVFLRRGDEFLPRQVFVGARINGSVEVLSGLAEGDEIVVKGCFQLKSKLFDELLGGAHVH